jgi:linoleoyl-CoA desaturase
MPVPLRFEPVSSDQFLKSLRKNINQYFEDKKLSTYANTEMVIKATFLIGIWIGSYAALMLFHGPVWTMYLNWMFSGVTIAWVTINVGHDAIHGAFSGKDWVNRLLSHTFNFNGASAYMWSKMHNTAHHTFTNVHGYDEDVESVPLLRLSPSTKKMGVHKFQHFYSFAFYCLATISWVFAKDYVKFFKNQVGNFGGKPHPKEEYFWLFFYKAINYTLFLVLPLIVLPYAWYQILTGFVLMHLVSGFYLAIVFMLAHIVEDTHFPIPQQNGTLENTWAVHQMYTTADFAERSLMASYLTGGLNLQVEHHLFPNICSIHYRNLAPIVQATAKEHGVPYISYPTFGEAVASHRRFLKKLGYEENPLPVNTNWATA